MDNGEPFGVQNVDPFGAQYSKSLDLGQDSGVVSFDSSENPELDSLDDLDREKERKSASVCALAAKEPFLKTLRRLRLPHKVCSALKGRTRLICSALSRWHDRHFRFRRLGTMRKLEHIVSNVGIVPQARGSQ